MVTACVFPPLASTTLLSEQQWVLFLSSFGTLVSLLQRGGGRFAMGVTNQSSVMTIGGIHDGCWGM